MDSFSSLESRGENDPAMPSKQLSNSCESSAEQLHAFRKIVFSVNNGAQYSNTLNTILQQYIQSLNQGGVKSSIVLQALKTYHYCHKNSIHIFESYGSEDGMQDLEKMGEILVVYCNIKLKNKKTINSLADCNSMGQRIIDMMTLYLDGESEHIDHVLLKLRNPGTSYRKRVLRIVFEHFLDVECKEKLTDLEYARKVLTFRVWKKLAEGHKRLAIMEKASKLLKAPSTFLYNHELFSILNPIPSDEGVTSYLMQKYNKLENSVQAYFKYIESKRSKFSAGICLVQSDSDIEEVCVLSPVPINKVSCMIPSLNASSPSNVLGRTKKLTRRKTRKKSKLNNATFVVSDSEEESSSTATGSRSLSNKGADEVVVLSSDNEDENVNVIRESDNDKSDNKKSELNAPNNLNLSDHTASTQSDSESLFSISRRSDTIPNLLSDIVSVESAADVEKSNRTSSEEVSLRTSLAECALSAGVYSSSVRSVTDGVSSLNILPDETSLMSSSTSTTTECPDAIANFADDNNSHSISDKLSNNVVPEKFSEEPLNSVVANSSDHATNDTISEQIDSEFHSCTIASQTFVEKKVDEISQLEKQEERQPEATSELLEKDVENSPAKEDVLCSETPQNSDTALEPTFENNVNASESHTEKTDLKQREGEFNICIQEPVYGNLPETPPSDSGVASITTSHESADENYTTEKHLYSIPEPNRCYEEYGEVIEEEVITSDLNLHEPPTQDELDEAKVTEEPETPPDVTIRKEAEKEYSTLSEELLQPETETLPTSENSDMEVTSSTTEITLPEVDEVETEPQQLETLSEPPTPSESTMEVDKVDHLEEVPSSTPETSMLDVAEVEVEHQELQETSSEVPSERAMEVESSSGDRVEEEELVEVETVNVNAEVDNHEDKASERSSPFEEKASERSSPFEDKASERSSPFEDKASERSSPFEAETVRAESPEESTQSTTQAETEISEDSLLKSADSDLDNTEEEEEETQEKFRRKIFRVKERSKSVSGNALKFIATNENLSYDQLENSIDEIVGANKNIVAPKPSKPSPVKHQEPPRAVVNNNVVVRKNLNEPVINSLPIQIQKTRVKLNQTTLEKHKDNHRNGALKPIDVGGIFRAKERRRRMEKARNKRKAQAAAAMGSSGDKREMLAVTRGFGNSGNSVYLSMGYDTDSSNSTIMEDVESPQSKHMEKLTDTDKAEFREELKVTKNKHKEPAKAPSRKEPPPPEPAKPNGTKTTPQPIKYVVSIPTERLQDLQITRNEFGVVEFKTLSKKPSACQAATLLSKRMKETTPAALPPKRASSTDVDLDLDYENHFKRAKLSLSPPPKAATYRGKNGELRVPREQDRPPKEPKRRKGVSFVEEVNQVHEFDAQSRPMCTKDAYVCLERLSAQVIDGYEERSRHRRLRDESLRDALIKTINVNRWTKRRGAEASQNGLPPPEDSHRAKWGQNKRAKGGTTTPKPAAMALPAAPRSILKQNPAGALSDGVGVGSAARGDSGSQAAVAPLLGSANPQNRAKAVPNCRGSKREKMSCIQFIKNYTPPTASTAQDIIGEQIDVPPSFYNLGFYVENNDLVTSSTSNCNDLIIQSNKEVATNSSNNAQAHNINKFIPVNANKTVDSSSCISLEKEHGFCVTSTSTIEGFSEFSNSPDLDDSDLPDIDLVMECLREDDEALSPKLPPTKPPPPIPRTTWHTPTPIPDPSLSADVSSSSLNSVSLALAESQLATALEESALVLANTNETDIGLICQETRLPFKKRRMSTSVADTKLINLPPEPDISYPATPMISIAELEGFTADFKKEKGRPSFKTPAELKEMPAVSAAAPSKMPSKLMTPPPLQMSPPSMLYNLSASEPSPIITDQFNINNHTYNNPTINYHMSNVPFINLPYNSYYHPMQQIILPFGYPAASNVPPGAEARAPAGKGAPKTEPVGGQGGRSGGRQHRSSTQHRHHQHHPPPQQQQHHPYHHTNNNNNNSSTSSSKCGIRKFF